MSEYIFSANVDIDVREIAAIAEPVFTNKDLYMWKYIVVTLKSGVQLTVKTKEFYISDKSDVRHNNMNDLDMQAKALRSLIVEKWQQHVTPSPTNAF